jgi:hypothetical protein
LSRLAWIHAAARSSFGALALRIGFESSGQIADLKILPPQEE